METLIGRLTGDSRIRGLAAAAFSLAAITLLMWRPVNWFGYPVWRSGVVTMLPAPTPVAPSLAKLVANRENGLADEAGAPAAMATRVRIEETASMPVRRASDAEAREERFYCVRVIGGESDGYRGWIGEDRLQKSSAR